MLLCSLSFGLTPTQPLNVPTLMPGGNTNISLPVSPGGNMQKMDPLTMIQVAVKNNVDVFYFGTVVPMHVFFTEDGTMGEWGWRVGGWVGPLERCVFLKHYCCACVQL